MDHEVLWVGDKTREWSSSHGGRFIDYRISVKDEGGVEHQAITLTQKPETAAPSVGQVIYGHIEEEEIKKRDGETFTKKKLKKDQRPEGSPLPSQAPSQTITATPPRTSGPVTDPYGDVIVRQVALKVVASLAQAVATQGNLPQDFSLTPHHIERLRPAVDAVVSLVSPPTNGRGPAVEKKPPALDPLETHGLIEEDPGPEF